MNLTRRSNRTPSNRSPLSLRRRGAGSLLCAAALLACASVQAQIDPRQTRLFCDPRLALCLATSPDRDSDGDGFSDAVEKAAGTDPFDSRSRPTVAGVLQTIAEMRLPESAIGRLLIVAPPTHAPDGRALAGIGSLAVVSSRKGFPARTSALQRLGIDSSLLTRAGLSPTGGFVIAPGGLVASPATVIGVGGISFGLVGMRLGQIATPGHSNPVSAVQSIGTGLAMRPDLTTSVVAFGVDPASGRVAMDHGRRITSNASSNTSLVANGSVSTSQVVITDSNGKVTGVADSTRSVTGGLATTNDSFTNSTSVTAADGSRINTTVSGDVTRKPDLSKVEKGSVASQVVRPDGSSSTIVVTTNTATDETDGSSTTTVTTERTDKDSKGNVTGTAQTTTTTATDANGKSTVTGSKTTCTGSAQATCPSSGTVNPDAAFDTVVLSGEEVARIVGVLRSRNTNSGTTILQYLTPEDVKDPDDPTPIALVDHEGNLQMMVTTPRLWNSSGGTVHTGSTGVEIPPPPPGQTPRDKLLGLQMKELMPSMPAGAAALLRR